MFSNPLWNLQAINVLQLVCDCILDTLNAPDVTVSKL